MISDAAMMSNMTSTPQNRITSNFRKWLYYTIFKYKAIISYRRTIVSCFRANICYKSIPLFLSHFIFFCPKMVISFISHRNKHFIFYGWVNNFNVFKWNHRPIHIHITFNKYFICCKCTYFIFFFSLQIKKSHLLYVTFSKNNHLFQIHQLLSSLFNNMVLI